MKLYNPDLEVTALKAVCHLDMVSCGKLLANLTTSSFHNPYSKEAYKYITKIAKTTGKLPEWGELAVSNQLTEGARMFLQATNTKRVKSKQSLERLLKALKEYEHYRMVYRAAEETIDKLSEGEFSIEEYKELLNIQLSELNTGSTNVADQLVHIGEGNNSSKLVESRLSADEVRVIPTGFRVFDEINGGLPIADLTMAAANTGGGKTALMAIQLLLNMCRFTPTVLVPLEMTEGQTTDRILSNISGVAIHKITSNRLTEVEKTKIRRAYRKMVLELKGLKSRYTIWAPPTDVTLDEVLYSLLPLGYKVMLIDYIGLLKGMSDEDQARKLGEAARVAKIFAKNHGVAVILLCQLSDDGIVRYSRAMKEHAATFWTWRYTQASRESGIISILPVKSRNQDPSPFDLWHDFSVMRVGDVTNDTIKNLDEGTLDQVEKTKKSLRELNKKISREDEGEALELMDLAG